jgi:hypothetical protein
MMTWRTDGCLPNFLEKVHGHLLVRLFVGGDLASLHSLLRMETLIP